MHFVFQTAPAWSNAYMNDMLRRMQIQLPAKFRRGLTQEQMNDLGDWLWYELHKDVQRPKKFDLPPSFLDPYLPGHFTPTTKERKERAKRQSSRKK